MTKDTTSEKPTTNIEQVLAEMRHDYECSLENDSATDVVCDCQLKDLESKLTSLVEAVREEERGRILEELIQEYKPNNAWFEAVRKIRLSSHEETR